MKENVEWIGPGLKAALESVRYPVHHLDFETLGPAILVYANTRPYQAIAFQWSNQEKGTGHLWRCNCLSCLELIRDSS